MTGLAIIFLGVFLGGFISGTAAGYLVRFW